MKRIKQTIRRIKLQALYDRANDGIIRPYRQPGNQPNLFIRLLKGLLKWLN